MTADGATLQFPAIVLAGGKTGEEFARAAGVPPDPGSRALAPIHGRPMVSYVLSALRSAKSVGRIVLVAPAGFPEQPEADRLVTADGELPDNIRAGIHACGGASHVLITTADIPFLTAEAVDDWISQSLAAGVDCCYAAIPEERCVKQFPGMKRTYLHATSGRVTGGNVVFQRVSAYENQAELLREAYRRRKNPVFLARLIGLGNVWKLLTHRLSLSDIDRAASERMGVRCRLLVTPHAELGTDVDRPEDLVLARQLLKPV